MTVWLRSIDSRAKRGTLSNSKAMNSRSGQANELWHCWRSGAYATMLDRGGIVAAGIAEPREGWRCASRADRH